MLFLSAFFIYCILIVMLFLSAFFIYCILIPFLPHFYSDPLTQFYVGQPHSRCVTVRKVRVVVAGDCDPVELPTFPARRFALVIANHGTTGVAAVDPAPVPQAPAEAEVSVVVVVHVLLSDARVGSFNLHFVRRFDVRAFIYNRLTSVSVLRNFFCQEQPKPTTQQLLPAGG